MQPADRHRERGEPEVRLGLTATGREPEEVADGLRAAPLGVRRVGQGREALQDKRQLKREPRRCLVAHRGALAARVHTKRREALRVHRAVREPKRLRGVRVARDHGDARSDALPGALGLGQHGRRHVRVIREPMLAARDLATSLRDPRAVPRGERREERREAVVGRLAERPHLEFEPGEPRIALRRARLRHVVRWERDRSDLRRTRRVAHLNIHLDRDAVADGELPPPAIREREPCRLGVAVTQRPRVVRDEHGATARGAHRERRLEEPRRVGERRRRRLLVAQKERDRVLRARPAHVRLDAHVGVLGRGHERHGAAVPLRREHERRGALARDALPHESLLGLLVLAFALVAPPPGRHLQGRAGRVDVERAAEARRQERARGGLLGLGVLLHLVVATRERLVLLRADACAARREHADEIAVARALTTGERLVVATGRAVQLADHERDEPFT